MFHLQVVFLRPECDVEALKVNDDRLRDLLGEFAAAAPKVSSRAFFQGSESLDRMTYVFRSAG
jgi:hypothetical protein